MLEVFLSSLFCFIYLLNIPKILYKEITNRLITQKNFTSSKKDGEKKDPDTKELLLDRSG